MDLEVSFQGPLDRGRRRFALDIKAVPGRPIDVFETDVPQRLSAEILLQEGNDLALPLFPSLHFASTPPSSVS